MSSPRRRCTAATLLIAAVAGLTLSLILRARLRPPSHRKTFQSQQRLHRSPSDLTPVERHKSRLPLDVATEKGPYNHMYSKERKGVLFWKGTKDGLKYHEAFFLQQRNVSSLAPHTEPTACKDAMCLDHLTHEERAQYDYCTERTIKNVGPLKNGSCRFLDGRSGRIPVALTSQPGSGNTWLRGLLELASGVCTGGWGLVYRCGLPLTVAMYIEVRMYLDRSPLLRSALSSSRALS